MGVLCGNVNNLDTAMVELLVRGSVYVVCQRLKC